MKPAERPAFTITVVADDDGSPPVIIRLRSFLKAALRRYGLRCVGVREAAKKPPEEAK
jgi:hypothetical protein